MTKFYSNKNAIEAEIFDSLNILLVDDIIFDEYIYKNIKDESENRFILICHNPKEFEEDFDWGLIIMDFENFVSVSFTLDKFDDAIDYYLYNEVLYKFKNKNIFIYSSKYKEYFEKIRKRVS